MFIQRIKEYKMIQRIVFGRLEPSCAVVIRGAIHLSLHQKHMYEASRGGLEEQKPISQEQPMILVPNPGTVGE